MTEEIKSSYINVQDDDGHYYYIPPDMKRYFYELCERAYSEGDFDDFIDKFEAYRTEGGPL